MIISKCDLKDIKSFVETNHYSKSVNGLKISQCYKLLFGGALVGGMIFGQLSTTAWKKYGADERDVVELRRLVTVDGLPKNTLSTFLSYGIRDLKKNSDYKIAISYADPHHSHVGFIYQATNWTYMGKTSPDIVLLTPEGKTYHSRAMRTKYNGQLKPFAQRLVDMDSRGELSSINVPGKFIYSYNLKNIQISNPQDYPKLI